MSRSAFGLWGVELDDATFAKALAALGLDEGRYLPRYLGAEESALESLAGPLLPWSLQFPLPPEVLAAPPLRAAEAWEALCRKLGPQDLLVLRPEQPHLAWALAQLRTVEGVGSLLFPAPATQEPVQWDWPLRVTLPDDPTAQALEQDVRVSWMLERDPPLARLVPVAGAERSNLLILPWTLGQSLARLLAQERPLRADFVLALGGHAGPLERCLPLLEALRTQSRAGGACSLRVEPEMFAGFFMGLMLNLSHNLPLHRAIHNACPDTGPYLLAMGTDFLDKARLAQVARTLVHRLNLRLAAPERAATPRRTPKPSTFQPLARRMVSDAGLDWKRVAKGVDRYLKSGRGAPRDVPAPLAPEAAEFKARIEAPEFFDREAHGASVIAEISRELAKQSPPPRPEPRYIQARVHTVLAEPSGDGPARPLIYSALPVRHALAAGKPHLAVVRIGPLDDKWLAAKKMEAFPDHLLPKGGESNLLQVTLVEPRHLPQPQQDQIILPQTGASSTCQFLFTPKPDCPEFAGRIIIRHKNRVLQTALLTAPVTADGELPEGAKPLEMAVETMPQTTMAGLTGRSEYGLALVANHSSQGEPGATLLQGDTVKYLHLHNLEKTLKKISNLLTSITDFPETPPYRLDVPETVTLLRDLAVHGQLLYRGIVKDQLKAGPLPGEPVQIVSAKAEAFIPVEFFYDRPAPAKNAALCPRAIECLESGRSTDCPQTEETGNPLICPLGFWCLSRAIERHAFDPDLAQAMHGSDFAVLAEPAPGRETLHPFSSVLYGASARVDSANSALRQDMLSAIPATSKLMVDNWQAWREAVRTGARSLLLLMPHTFPDEDYDCPAMEIGPEDSEPLQTVYIDAKYVTAEGREAPPLVMLLGCETALSGLPYESLVAEFRRNGAALVLSTLGSVLGRHVVPVAQNLVRLMQERTRNSSVPFGEILRDARRAALAQGLPMALCLVAYGDAHWLISNP